MDDMTITGVREHYYGAVLIAEPDLSLAWSMEDERDLHLPSLTERFPDKSLSSYKADVMLRGVVVHREMYLVVDGGRAYLPIPRAMLSSLTLGDAEIIAEQVTQWQDAFMRLINELTQLHEYESYRDRAGFVVIAGHPLDH